MADRGLHADFLSATLAETLIPAGFIQINTPSGNTYLWLGGLGTITWNSVNWVGNGRALGVSPVTEAVGAQAQGVVGKLAGLDTDNLTLVYTNIRRYMPVRMWIAALSQTFLVVANPYEVFRGRVDKVEVEEGGETSTIFVSAENKLITLMTPLTRRFTDQDQRIERPYDGGFKFVDSMQDANTQWNGLPTKTASSAGSSMPSGNTPGGVLGKLRLGRSV